MLAAALVALTLLGGGPPVAAADLPSRAQSLIETGRPAEAVPLLREAVAAAPDDADLHFLLGVALHRAGQPAEAVAAFERAAALDPDSGKVQYNLSASLFALERWDAAAAAFVAVPERSPALAGAALLGAGLARYKQGRPEDAEALFRRSLAADPDGSSADTARVMLDLMAPETAEPAVRGEDRPAPPARPARDTRRLVGALSLGREYDSNVFALPDDATTTDLSDWRTAVDGEVEYRLEVGNRYLVRPRYDFYGYWYNAETAYNYRRHRLRVRVDDQAARLRPRLTYAYAFSELGGDAYIASHRLDGRLTVYRSGSTYLWTGLGLALEEAPGQRYDYLSGIAWEASVSGYTRAGDTRVYAALNGRYLDRGTAAATVSGVPVSVDYSYAALEPVALVRHPLPWWRIEASGTLRYELRRYVDPDVWAGATPGSKRRLDHKASASLALARPLAWGLELELAWRGQVRRSNIGDDPTDYRDRDYTRQVYGVFLKGEL